MRTGHYAAAPRVTVLANNTNVQAVHRSTLGITAANFWTDTSQTIGGITSNKKASVLVRDDGPLHRRECKRSHPAQHDQRSPFKSPWMGVNLVSADEGVTVTRSAPTIALTVSTANSAGKTFQSPLLQTHT